MSDHLILGLAAGYHYGDVRPFLSSLERSGFTGRCVLFVSDTTRDLDRMAEHAVTITPLAKPEGIAHLPYNALRYFLYLDYLYSAETEFERILITDVRDVIFQDDPFAHAWPDGINCTLEDASATLGGCPYNSHWIQGHQGKETLAEVAGKRISCSGTTVADHAGMLHYLKTMTDRLVPYTPGERMAGYDQGVHNVLLHDGALPCLTLHDNCGPILTLASTKGEPDTDEAGFVLNDNGKRAHMVHQYDRKPDLFKMIRQRYA
ncbi:hypothetical protein [uncultured Pseudodesulfovibrio sp.]|uniref:hypothetical protein n=1 Tax=uncultured Pseudodesulfovibrio sp. TaxID=2035858 RepID=UPI0029C9468C|nr:hypothetical protein [uncultured Pseudodesulfovibrio sp.]